MEVPANLTSVVEEKLGYVDHNAPTGNSPNLFGFFFQKAVDLFVTKSIESNFSPKSVHAPTWEAKEVTKTRLDFDNVSVEIQLVSDEGEKPSILNELVNAVSPFLLRRLPNENAPNQGVPDVPKLIKDFDERLENYKGLPKSILALSKKLSRFDNDPHADSVVIYLTTVGLAAPFLEPISSPEEGYKYFSLDFTALRDCELQEKDTLPYGAGAKLRWGKEKGWELVSLTYAKKREDGTGGIAEIFNPGTDTAEWVYAKQMLRCTIIVFITIVHLMVLHFASASSLAVSTVETLGRDHPMAQLLNPFFFRSSLINTVAVHFLVPQWGVFHRMTAFSFKGMKKALGIVYNRCTHSMAKLPLMDDGTDEALLLSPIVGDLRDFRACLKGQIGSIILSLFPTEEALMRDPSMDRFFDKAQDLLRHIPDSSKRDREGLVNMLSQLIFELTACHELFGNVSPHVRNPLLCSPALREGNSPNERVPNEARIKLSQNLGIFVSEEMPPLIGDYSHAAIDERVFEFFKQWPEKWKALVNAQKERNHDFGGESEIDLEMMAMSIAI